MCLPVWKSDVCVQSYNLVSVRSSLAKFEKKTVERQQLKERVSLMMGWLSLRRNCLQCLVAAKSFCMLQESNPCLPTHCYWP